MSKIATISDEDISQYLDVIFSLKDYRPTFVDIKTPLYRDEPRTLREIIDVYTDEEHKVWYKLYTFEGRDCIEVFVKNNIGYIMKQDDVILNNKVEGK